VRGCVMADMDDVQEYRRCAEECVAIANSLSNPAQRVALLEMARAWLGLADRAGRRSRGLTDNAPAVESPPPE
jgi:hypothetical protein